MPLMLLQNSLTHVTLGGRKGTTASPLLALSEKLP